MTIQNTQHLSKLSDEEMKSVLKKWPNPLQLIAIMLGSLGVVGYQLLAQSKGEGSLGSLIGSLAVFLVLTLGALIFIFIKLSRAKKALGILAGAHSLPNKELFGEFRSNLQEIKKL